MIPTKEQSAVINHKDGPLLVIAGPGSGKTYTIVERVQKLVQQGVDAKKILCITFTEKATEVMANRLEKLGNAETTVSTFHKFCQDACTDNFIQSGLSDKTKLMKERSLQVWCLKNTDRFNLDPDVIDPGTDLPKVYRGMVQAISNFKESLITSDQLQKWLEQKQKEIDKFTDKEKKENKNKELIEYVKDHREFNKVYAKYEELQQKTQIFDFDDMLSKAIRLFKKNPTILTDYQDKYDYILVDEFQDNNFSQYELVRLLGQHGNVMVVGDDDQLIMRFQGARQENFDAFLNDFSGAKEKRLGENHRSTENIVEVSKLVLDNINKNHRRTKNLSSSKKSKDKVQVIRTDTDAGEVEFVVEKIQEILKKKFKNRDGKNVNFQYSDIAILTRNREFGDKFVRALNTYNVPTTHVGDLNIFETSIITELMLYLRIINSPSSSGMYLDKLMASAGIDDPNISTINHMALKEKRHVYEGQADAVFEVMKKADETYFEEETYLDEEGKEQTRKIEKYSLDITQKSEIKAIVNTIESAIKFAAKSSVLDLVYHLIFSDTTGLMKRSLQVNNLENRLNVILLNKFYEITEEFQNLNPDDTYQQFLNHLTLLRSIKIDVEETLDIENTVHVMTMHKAKGKEYPVVFIADVAGSKFPTPHRTSTFFVHDELTKGKTSLTFSEETQDEDERRLFYVAITRAENLLYIIAPKRYSDNKRDKPLSTLLSEIEFDKKPKLIDNKEYKYKGTLQSNPKEPLDKIKDETQKQAVNSINTMQLDVALARVVELARVQYFEQNQKTDPECKNFDPKKILSVNISNLNLSQPLSGTPLPLFNPKKLTLSKSSLETYKKCPYMFQLSKLMRIPTSGNVFMDLGSSVHKMIQETVDKTGSIPTKKEALKKLEEKWIFKSYSNKRQETSFLENAKKMTDVYLKWRKTNKNTFVASEKHLEFAYGGITLNGKIDWIEQDANGEYEIVDFKTGAKISQNKADEDWQIHIYAKLIEKEYGKLPTKATLYFLAEDVKRTVIIDKKKAQDILDNELKPLIDEVLKGNFTATPGAPCYRCDYKDICSFKV